jgi:hypothetical protein
VVSLGLMASLNFVTWVRLVVWLIIGLVIYFTYSVKHSFVRNLELPEGYSNSLPSPLEKPEHRDVQTNSDCASRKSGKN